jgi:rod shape determining protein RodA
MRSRSLLNIDWWLILPVFILLIIGLTTIFSLNSALFANQLFSLGISLATFIVFANVRYEFFKQFALPIYVVSLVLLAIVFIIGFESRGAVRWINFFGFPIQFSEVLKPFLAIALASFLAPQNNTSLRAFIVSSILLLPIFLLIALQPDLGNALIYASVFLFVLLVYGFPFRFFIMSAIPFLISSPFIWHSLRGYQKQRILTFINPTSDPLGTSYNVVQAMIAVGSGMFLGKGISQGTQSGLRFLPERHTDFIFATLSEEMGFAGSLIVILCFIFLCFRIYKIVNSSDDLFTRIFATSAFGFILVHFFVNIGMNIGLVPIVGVTLPFVSYGGSSLLSNFILLGILSSMSTNLSKRNVLEIR